MSSAPSHLLLSTLDAQLARRSGYQLLAEYLPDGESITAPRLDPTHGWRRLASGAARKLAFSRWYLGGCAQMEWRAWQRIRRGFQGIVHYLWCDRDLGFLDLLLDQQRHSLVGTFHNCADLLPGVIRSPHRLRKAAAIILMSETQRAFFRAAGVPDERIHFLPHGVDTAFFVPKREGASDEFVALSVGGYRRNFSLLRELCLALKSEPTMRFEIVGPATAAGHFLDLENVRFFSGLSGAELLAKYQHASCLLHVAEQATANNVVLEALACGLPVVSERIGGVPEYVDASCGLLAEPAAAAQLLAALRQLAASPTRRDELSHGARQRAEALAWPIIAARTLALYQSLA